MAEGRSGSPQLFQLKPKLVGEIALGLTGLFGPGPGGPPSAKCDGIMVNFPLFLEEFDPLRQLSWLAEGGGLMQRCMTSVLFWPSANSLPWRDGVMVQKLIIILSDLPRNDDGLL